jgi:alpha-N-arabinofuranosidase
MKDALGVAAALHEFFRNSDIVFMANYAQTVNVIGCIKTTATAAGFETTALPLMLYRRHFGIIPVPVGGEPRPLDVAAAWTRDRKALTIGVVNPTEFEYELSCELKNARLSGRSRRWVIEHADPMAYNEPGREPAVQIKEEPVRDFAGTMRLPAVSVTVYELSVR